MDLKMVTNVPVPLLLTRKEDYKYWKKCMTTYLESEGLRDIVERSKTGDAKDSGRKMDSKALHAIQVSCSPEILDPILKKLGRTSVQEGLTSAKEGSNSTQEVLTTPTKGDTSAKKGSTSALVWTELEKWADSSPISKQAKEYKRYNPLFKAISEGNWDDLERFLKDHPEALKATISDNANTVLIDAVTAGHRDIVAKLVNQMSEEDLEAKDKDGYTALAAAAQGGITVIAKTLVTKNRKLLSDFTKKGKKNPLVIASENGHEEMTRYLYNQTRIEELQDKVVVDVLTHCISRGTLFDIALDILQRRPKLLEKPFDKHNPPLLGLSQIPSAFLSSSFHCLSNWKKLLYHCITVQSKRNASRNTHRDIECPNVVSTDPKSTGTISEVTEFYPRGFTWTFLKSIVPAFEEVYKLKQRHDQAMDVLKEICTQILLQDVSEFENFGVYASMFKAIKYGIEEVFEEIIKCHPYIVWGALDGKGRNILSYAILKRQEKIYNIILNNDNRMPILALKKDNNKNNVLHQAAIVSSSLDLDNKVTGAALQMQRELQWFEAVKKIAQPRYILKPNKDGKNPKRLFTDQHKGLAKEGEKWAKGVASSCSVVATLIATIMFSVAFSVPGGLNIETEKPLLFNNHFFVVFIISDALSLFSSATSALVFLGILTSRYNEEDFLKSLPTRLIIGLGTLFFSIVTMMVVFGTTLLIMLLGHWGWVSIPVVLLACGPVFLYALYQFPLLVEIIKSTYVLRINDDPKKK